VAFQGIDVLGVDAEVQIAQGLPAFNIVGPIATLFRRSMARIDLKSDVLALGVPVPARLSHGAPKNPPGGLLFGQPHWFI
jgi:magnesium chelatase family protein